MQPPKVAFISGHLDVTIEEFREHYCPKILEAIAAGHNFVVGDARGVDNFANMFLGAMVWQNNRVTVYHMFTRARNNVCGHPTCDGFGSDAERDVEMTAASDYDIAWVREGREKSGTARNIARRTGCSKN
jgi:hypothetical protein